MKFLTLEHGQLGMVLNDEVIDVAGAAAELYAPVPADTLQALIEAGDAALMQVEALARRAQAAGIACRDLAGVRPLAPLPVPRRNIFCLGKNYLEHAREVAARMQVSDAPPAKPIFFTKATTAVIGPGAAIPAWSELTRKLDYEAELALVIGKGGINIPAAQAWSHVFGYTALNDVSARDLQKDHHQWFRAKSLDGFAPMGPCVVHRGAMPAPAEIEVKCFVNGEQRQCARLDQLIFPVPEIIETLSAGMTLLPGDIIATGTPAGVGMGFRPPKYLQPGDEVVVDVTGVGELRNPVL